MATVVAKSLKYMDTRSVYWKQQMPLSIMTTVQAPRRGAAGSRVGRESVEEGDEGFSRKYAKLLSDIMQCNEGEDDVILDIFKGVNVRVGI